MSDNLVTKREWLVARGLAKAGVVGRFSNDAKEALAKAVADGVKFVEDQPKAPATPRESKPKAPKIVITQPYDAGKVRKWALANNVAVGERGRIKPEVVKAYLDATGGEPTATPTPAAILPVAPVRSETEAYVLMPRKEGDGPHISEPLVTISNCRCGSAIAYCNCKDGPFAPSYLTNGESVKALLVKPTI